jgi:hypothetical protein
MAFMFRLENEDRSRAAPADAENGGGELERYDTIPLGHTTLRVVDDRDTER